jgi:FKBP-type peptidyl-prolyl cis-trans isomerase 2
LKKKEHELEDVTGKGKLASGFNNHILKSQAGKVINVSITQNSATGILGELSLGLDFISNGWVQE